MLTQVTAWGLLCALTSMLASGWIAAILAGAVVWLSADLIRVRRRVRQLRQQTDLGVTTRATDVVPGTGYGDANFENGLSMLAAGFAHDFNNLLVGVMANAELLKMSPDDNCRQDCVTEIIACADAAAKLTKQITNYVGSDSPAKMRVDLRRWVNSLLPTLRARLRSNHEIRIGPSSTALSAAVDVTQLERILANLVMNAADASPPGSVIEIRFGKKTLDRQVQSPNIFGDRKVGGRFVYFEVLDQGSGISGDTLGRIFRLFHTSKGTGRGLGMSIVLRCVNNHDGLIECQSKLGHGTRMRVLLPESTRQPNSNDLSTSRYVLGQSGARQPTAVVLDNDQTAREQAGTLLQQQGWRVAMFQDVESADIYLAKRGRIVRFLVVNESLFSGDGSEFANWVAAHNPTVPFVVLSDNPSRFADRTMMHGVAAVVQLPLNPRRFLATVRKIVRNSAARAVDQA